ncbi:uncharacterized protein BXIN_2590 [Babesia sp. Xinjiang]|uniref:uncharacterized protein n=1 Tax=Babesia sp. Xinjiang TaxID=462227 RepID=UPI000A258A7E|nr:uncharacterized protein BXIN_2590 [Babesia sp. Xinjiang]ORM41500.1 hypothetical protein BXIN_2590 [Babesia sp. Xinjiang]
MKGKRRRSEEAAIRHRQRYMDILKRRNMSAVAVSASHFPKPSHATVAPQSLDDRRPICKYYYRTGNCVHGSDCNFSHDCIPLTSKELKLCRYYLRGPSHCMYSASECKYSHDPGLFLCRNNVICGECSNESHCIFKHLDAASMATLDDAERLKFCYNNKRFLTELLLRYVNGQPTVTPSEVNIGSSREFPDDDVMPQILALKEPFLERLPWYLQLVHTLLLRDYELKENE